VRARVTLLTLSALAGFAANSLLCRAALAAGAADAVTFTTVRIVSGAVVLATLAARTPPRVAPWRAGSGVSAAALFAYALLFSLAYVRIGAAVGALLLFGAVQATMLGWGIARGERPRRREWAGLGLALGGLVALVWPGLSAPDPRGAVLMLGAGVAWGVYSLRGRGAREPLRETAGNFVRAVPLALVASVAAFSPPQMDARGALLAVLSGALASGVGYSLWYAALPVLTATRAAIVQLSVPVLAAGAAALLLGETAGPRLMACGAAILGGVALALTARARRSP
jgi:drug/metabolite transporter (DMT)-like permease